MRSGHLRIAYAGLVLALGCREPVSQFDTEPITYEPIDGVVTTRLQIDGTDYNGVIDTLSPFTVLHSPSEEGRIDVSVFLDGLVAGDWIRRAGFTRVDVLKYSLCGAASCAVGINGQYSLGAILGADILARNAVRFSLTDAAIEFFPDIAGTLEQRTELCEAVFEQTMRGGGFVSINSTNISYVGRRPIIGACAAYNLDPTTTTETSQGLDLTLAIGSGVPITLLAESAYTRYLAYDPTATPLDQLPQAEISLIDGPVAARLASLPRLALVGQLSDQRGPCWERRANIVQVEGNGQCPTAEDCPCFEDERSCATAAVVELSDTVEIAIVEDTTALVRSLRNELRPDIPELDGVLSMADLTPTEIDLDYANDRILVRCEDESKCLVRPRVIDAGNVTVASRCLSQ